MVSGRSGGTGCPECDGEGDFGQKPGRGRACPENGIKGSGGAGVVAMERGEWERMEGE